MNCVGIKDVRLSKAAIDSVDYNFGMTLRGDSRRLARKLDQRKAVKLRTFNMWSDTGERLPYSPGWVIEPSDTTHVAGPSVPNFAAHSPLGSGEWIAPWHQRWSLPTK